jgi:hypothetical protein
MLQPRRPIEWFKYSARKMKCRTQKSLCCPAWTCSDKGCAAGGTRPAPAFSAGSWSLSFELLLGLAYPGECFGRSSVVSRVKQKPM